MNNNQSIIIEYANVLNILIIMKLVILSKTAIETSLDVHEKEQKNTSDVKSRNSIACGSQKENYLRD